MIVDEDLKQGESSENPLNLQSTAAKSDAHLSSSSPGG